MQNAVSTAAYLSQINMAISALGGGLAVGASIKISEAMEKEILNWSKDV